MRFLIVVSIFLSSVVSADTLSVKIDCKDGKCFPSAPNTAELTKQVNSLNRRLVAAKKALERADISRITGDELVALKEKVKSLEGEVKNLNAALNAVGVAVISYCKNLSKVVLELGAKLKKLEDEVSSLFTKMDDRVDNFINETNTRLNNRKVNLDIGAFGLFTSPFGLSAGGVLTLDLPLGEGLWRARLSGGLGVSPSVNLSALTSLSVVRKFSFFSVGPAILAVMDVRNVIENRPLWIAGGGAEIRFSALGFNFWAMPFVGAGPGDTTTTKTSYTYAQTPCGKVVSEVAAGTTNKTDVVVHGGVVVGITYSLF